MRACRWPPLRASDKNDTVATSAVSHRTQNKHFFLIGCFRCWTKQPPTRARTSARCIMGTIYQSHHALQALNTATVFLCVSPLFFHCHLSHLSLSLSPPLWTAPLLVQLSLSNACKEKVAEAESDGRNRCAA